ncbi:NAD(P)-binding protein [Favolaschia claudopus]|uniref:NAD(P)-binding protein n=1 Tax=Favolaschia claudopus TaxID=2862362 RepID=A0AAW0C243_9AGAR
MTFTKNSRVLFNSVPTGYPVPGETTVYDSTQTIDLENVSLEGGILLKTLVLSVDPYFRVLMNGEGHPASFQIGKPLYGFGIAKVLRSENTGFAIGQHVFGYNLVHEEYSVVPDPTGLQIMDKVANLPWSVYLGPAGLPGQTAYIGWKEFANAKEGETVFVTTGAGMMVIQLAKQAGLKVIASAGSEEKVKFMKSIGADVAFNYKFTDTRGVLAKEGPIDIYWDNVGGDILDAALEFSAVQGRFLECGAISGYNTGHQPLKNFHLICDRSLHIHGVLMGHLPIAKYIGEFYATMLPKLASGEIKFREDVSHGLDKMGDVILAVQKGSNKAKAVVVVAED